MPRRVDITNTLVHFVSAETNAEALETLWRIIQERRLRGSNRLIKGGYRCVCFTETPVELVTGTLMEAERTGHRYKPFGIAVTKPWLFELGGRPVIYGPAEQFDELPEPMRWRHMRYEPSGTEVVDFTWEREWRLLADSLALDPQHASLILPNREAFNVIASRHDNEEATRYEIELFEGGELYADWPRPFPWSAQLVDT